MSTTLCWAPKRRNNTSLPDKLKYVLQKRYGGAVHEEVNDLDIPYLQGLADAGVDGASELIEAVEKHGTVVLSED